MLHMLRYSRASTRLARTLRRPGSLSVRPTDCLAALAQVTAFYHGLVTSASSRQFFLSAEPYDLPQPKQRRDYRKVTFK